MKFTTTFVPAKPVNTAVVYTVIGVSADGTDLENFVLTGITIAKDGTLKAAKSTVAKPTYTGFVKVTVTATDSIAPKSDSKYVYIHA